MKIFIDNGHGENTAGKCSPDKRLREYAYCREIAAQVVKTLKDKGFDAELLVPEKTDISISTRCKRVNDYCSKVKAKTSLPYYKIAMLVSVHNNAARSDGKWANDVMSNPPSGFSVFCSKNASDNSKKLAGCFTDLALNRKLTGNRSIPKGKFWTWSWTTKDIGILRGTYCPAVLTENFFQDNRKEVDWMLTDAGKKAIVSLHVDAILAYLKEIK